MVRNESQCFLKSTDMFTCLCISIGVTQEEAVIPKNTLVNLALLELLLVLVFSY